MSKKDKKEAEAAEKMFSDFLNMSPEEITKSIRKHPDWAKRLMEMNSMILAENVQLNAAKSLTEVKQPPTGHHLQGSKSLGGKSDHSEHLASQAQSVDAGTATKPRGECMDKADIEEKYPAVQWEDLLKKLEQCIQGKEDEIKKFEDKWKELDPETQQSAEETSQTQSSKQTEKPDKNDTKVARTKEEKQKPAKDSQLSSQTKQSQAIPASGLKEKRQSDSVSPISHSKQARMSPTTGQRGKQKDDADWRKILQTLAKHLRARDVSIADYEQEVKGILDRSAGERKTANEEIQKAVERANNIERTLNKLLQDNAEVEADNKKYKEDLEKVIVLKLDVERKYFNLKSEQDCLLVEKKDVDEKFGNLCEAYDSQMETLKKLSDDRDRLKKLFEDEMKNKNKQLEVLKKEKDDYRDRFSKMAGDKLTEKNADIADLSDPNRAMKLAEKFSGLYDDEWTDAFQALGDSKMQPKDSLKLLLRILQTCYDSCERIAGEQFESLTSAVVFPAKTVGRVSKEMPGGMKSAPRLGSKNEKILRDARRQMWKSSVDVVKQSLMEQTKEWIEKENGPKVFESIAEYVEKCVEICWLMVIHDPPVYMKTQAEPDEKMDPNVYTAYSASGQKVDFIVWPPLYNGKGGGLLAKGVVETIRTVTKEKKK